MIAREQLRQVFRAAVAACDPAPRVRALRTTAAVASRLEGRAVRALAIGKAAAAMARGLGAVTEGLAIVPAASLASASPLPAGWRALGSAHPIPDDLSVAAAEAALALVGRATAADAVVALISGGASALVERPRPGLTIAELAEATRAAMAAGLPIAALNALRATLSTVKAGGLIAACAAPVMTLAVSDVIGDDLAIIGGGPTIAPTSAPARANDVARVITPIEALSIAAVEAWRAVGVDATRHPAPLADEVGACAVELARLGGPSVAWGEPVVRVPDGAGEGGRAQQLALHLAGLIRGTPRVALIVGSDGIDGPPPASRPPPAGAFVDGTTWDAITRAGLDPAAALDRCDAGTALAAVDALEVTGPTGINHADLVLLA